jgi:hypothetical protein
MTKNNKHLFLFIPLIIIISFGLIYSIKENISLKEDILKIQEDIKETKNISCCSNKKVLNFGCRNLCDKNSLNYSLNTKTNECKCYSDFEIYIYNFNEKEKNDTCLFKYELKNKTKPIDLTPNYNYDFESELEIPEYVTPDIPKFEMQEIPKIGDL